MKIYLSLLFFTVVVCCPFFAFVHPGIKKNTQTVVVLLGPPGSGKGTQAAAITQKLGIPHISTGEILRENINKQTPLGAQAKEYMESGRLVPDQLVLNMLFDRISQEDCSKGYLLDGFPRTIPQAESLEHYLKNRGVDLVVLNLEVGDETVIKRICGRLSCGKCGYLYNLYFSPPKVEGICDHCKAELTKRSDDNVETVKERLNVYKQQTAPLIDFYQKRGVLHTIDGEKDPASISSAILQILTN